MYQKFYNFSAEPFRLSPEHSFAFSHKGFTKARAYMDYAFMRAEGFVMITGRPGTGKTTLIGALVDDLVNTPVSVANLVCTQLQADDLLKMVAYEFGIPVAVVEKGELIQRLTRQLKSWYREGRRALLIVDEAQDLSVSAMEELRLLTNIQMESRPLLQIFLLGQPQLRELILTPQLEQVHQRIIAASHMQPLEKDETEAYIRHRLKVVHWRGDPAISKAVYPLVYKFSEGVPRRINLICSRLLLHCSVEKRHQVKVADVRDVIKELQSEKLASGESFTESDFKVKDVFDEVVPEREEADEKTDGKTNESASEKANKKTNEKVINKASENRESANQEGDDWHREVGDLTQRRVAAGGGQVAPVPELRSVPAKGPAPAPASNQPSQKSQQESKKKSPPRPTAKTEWQPIIKPDPATAPPPKKKPKTTWSTVMMLLVDCVLMMLLVAGILIIVASWA